MILLSVQFHPPPDFSSFDIKKKPLATKKKGTASLNMQCKIYQPVLPNIDSILQCIAITHSMKKNFNTSTKLYSFLLVPIFIMLYNCTMFYKIIIVSKVNKNTKDRFI